MLRYPRQQEVQTPEMHEKYEVIQQAIAKEEEGDRAYDPERDGEEVPVRPFFLTHAVCIALAMVLVVVVEFSCVASRSKIIVCCVNNAIN